ncbi:hypothetical protein BGX28_006218 [Mortierella sp. GBA30]|nr:hypothetical protein BGX28_006218 [Mortierella sp. GBA30]
MTLTLATALLLVIPFAQNAHAQAPVSSRRMGFTQMNDVLYIQGGFDTDNPTGQFVSLDLSKSWSATSPQWTKLKDGQSTSHLALASISPASNGGRSAMGSILAIGGIGTTATGLPAFFGSFDLSSGAWSNLTLKAPYLSLEGHAVVSDPNTGLVYIIGGNGNNSYNQLSVYDPKSQSMVSQQSATPASSLTDVGAVWSSARNTILTFGGSRAPPAATQGLGSSSLDEYDPSSRSWRTMSTSGDVPSPRLDHCMAASEDGSKIVLFGGTDGATYFNTIYILDVDSGKWKQGQSAPVARTRMACGFHSYQFVAWGGSSGAPRNTMLNNIPMIYNLNQDKWTDSYDASEQKTKSNVGGIIGGIFAVLLVVGAGLWFVMMKRRKRREEEAAFRADAAATAAVLGNEDEYANIKVLASPDMEHPQYTNVAIDSYGVHGGNGNEYPLSKMDINDPHVVAAARARYEGYHQDSSVHVTGGSVSGASGSGQASEKTLSPGTNYASASATAVPTPQLQSPAAVYQMNTLYQPSPHLGFHQGDKTPNPFMSAADYHEQTSAPGSAAFMPSSLPPSSNPFAIATSSEGGYHHPPLSTGQDPFQHYLAPSFPTAVSSPSPGARSPQVIPESPTTSYIPPPPM